VQVQVLTDGFAYAGSVYLSLSAVAKAITGSHCNGYWFFRNTLNHTKEPAVVGTANPFNWRIIGRGVLYGRSRQRRNGWWQRFWGKSLHSHLRGLESTLGIVAEAQERAIWERSADQGIGP
jgi:hypothetical protein